MKANNFFVTNMDTVPATSYDDSSGHNSPSYFLSALLSVNASTPSPTEEDIVWRNPNAVHRIVEIVGIVVALAVGAVIILSVAFIMSKLRKRNNQRDEDINAEVHHVDSNFNIADANIPHYDIKHVYSITGIVSTPKAKRSMKTILVPNFFKKKGDIADVHEAIRKDLSRIYVY